MYNDVTGNNFYISLYKQKVLVIVLVAILQLSFKLFIETLLKNLS